MRPKFQNIHVGTTPSGVNVEIMDCHSFSTSFLNRIRNRPVEPVICLSGRDVGLGWVHIEVQDVDALCELLKEAKRRCQEISKGEEK